MKILEARILDPTHLELSEAVAARPGEQIRISLLDPGEDDPAWRDASKRNLLLAYDEQDAIYDEL